MLLLPGGSEEDGRFPPRDLGRGGLLAELDRAGLSEALHVKRRGEGYGEGGEDRGAREQAAVAGALGGGGFGGHGACRIGAKA